MERRLELHHRPKPASEPIPARPLAGSSEPAATPRPVDDDRRETDAELRTTLAATALMTDRLVERLGHRRLAEIRGRLSSGAYRSREVIHALAVRMLESGDLA